MFKVSGSVNMATCTHQIYWPCKHYQYEKCDHRRVCFWLLSTAPVDDMNLKSLELIARRLINYQRIDIFMSDLIHATKKLLNIIPCSCPNQATYIDSFILKENVVTYTKTTLIQHFFSCPWNDGCTKFHSYSNKSTFKSQLFVWSF